MFCRRDELFVRVVHTKVDSEAEVELDESGMVIIVLPCPCGCTDHGVKILGQ